ncbi:SIMPL domain-containing protein [Halobacillus yeomjeoni]|uniref:SIMPL domain-containing protein n=2 Tax=Halobacillus yeomjeoni TaxID=311194 RepID=A0A931MTF6_9BACI|nr:SIMPL domain-containing protein [Halobacillus yeomjeoni]MBH0228883.1 SIMPL domain-containing protein [Halobacillus yeomjeoni]
MYYPMMNNNHRNNEGRLMTVNGSGKVLVQPDTAVVQIGVVTKDEELTKAQQDNADQIQQITDALNQAGIADEQIQTQDYYIYPEYDYVDGKQEFRGYQVTHMLSVTIDDIEQTGTIIDLAVANGANRVSNIQFTLKNAQMYYQEALSIALGNALANAQTIANTLQLNLDQTPVKIVESSIVQPSPVQPYMKAETASYSATPIEPGEQEVVAKVEAQFQYFS